MAIGRYAFPLIIVICGVVIAWFALKGISLLKMANLAAWIRFTGTVFLILEMLVALGVAASAAYNAILEAHFRATAPGDIYAVNDHKMRIQCMGGGSPTIVLDAGLGNDGFIWGGVQPELAKTTRVCSYDRAGFGLSDPLPPPRDADHIAAELHDLLASAKISAPIVLMGHSISGIYIRDYASHYPADVAGLVFVDGSTPLQNQNPAFLAHEPLNVSSQLAMLIRHARFSLGLSRLKGACSEKLNGFDDAAAKLQNEDQCTFRFDSIAREMESFTRSGEETVHTGPYGALPILIFSQDPQLATAYGEAPDVASAWNQMQEDLKKLSTRSRRIIAKGSPHSIQIRRADLIEKEVPIFIEQVRGTAPEPSNYGSTVTE